MVEWEIDLLEVVSSGFFEEEVNDVMLLFLEEFEGFRILFFVVECVLGFLVVMLLIELEIEVGKMMVEGNL